MTSALKADNGLFALHTTSKKLKDFIIYRYLFEEPVFFLLIVKATAVVIVAVADNKDIGVYDHIVSRNLIKDLLCNLDVFGFVFDNCYRSRIS
jgi:hypothetical protein